MEGQELYKAQDLLKGYGLEGRKVSDTLTEWKRTEFLIRENPVSVKGGTNKGTWLDKKALVNIQSPLVSEGFNIFTRR